MADSKNYPFMWTKCSKEEQEGNSNHNYDMIMDIGLILLFTINYFFRI